jgi:transposase
VTRYTSPPEGATTVCVDELGPVTPRTFPPAPGWSPDGHRVKVPLEYSRGPEKVWVYGGLRVRDGQAVTLTTRSRNTAGYRQLLEALAAANPSGDLYLIADNLASHKSAPILAWLAEHPRVHQVFIPKGACWLNLQEAWWRLFRRAGFAGQTFADDEEIDRATEVATKQLNKRAKPWIWGRPQRPPRVRRTAFSYRI